MFVQKIGGLDKTRFGINFKADDIKCNIKTNIDTDINNKIFKDKNKLK
jgi:hypothetical protein